MNYIINSHNYITRFAIQQPNFVFTLNPQGIYNILLVNTLRLRSE